MFLRFNTLTACTPWWKGKIKLLRLQRSFPFLKAAEMLSTQWLENIGYIWIFDTSHSQKKYDTLIYISLLVNYSLFDWIPLFFYMSTWFSSKSMLLIFYVYPNFVKGSCRTFLIISVKIPSSHVWFGKKVRCAWSFTNPKWKISTEVGDEILVARLWEHVLKFMNSELFHLKREQIAREMWGATSCC